MRKLVNRQIDDIKQLNKTLELLFIPFVIIGLAVILLETITGYMILSFVIAGALVIYSMILSYTWVSSMDKEEVTLLLQLKGSIVSLAQGQTSALNKLWHFVRTSSRIIIYPTISLLMVQLVIYNTSLVRYSITEIVLASAGLVTVFHFLPFQLRVQSLRRQSHDFIDKANISTAKGHLYLHDHREFTGTGGEEYRQLVRTVTTNTEIISVENRFLKNTESDPNLTIIRYVIPAVLSVITTLLLDSLVSLLLEMI